MKDHKAESALAIKTAVKAAVASQKAVIDGLRLDIDDLEQYGRRKNIRIQGVEVMEGKDEDVDQDILLTSVNKTLAPSGIVLEHKHIIRFHRSSAIKDDKFRRGVKSSQVIVKLKNWPLRRQFQGLNAKMRAKEDKKEQGCRVYHDLTKRRLALVNEARALCRDGWFCYADVNSNLKLRKGMRFLNFNTRKELLQHANANFPAPVGEEVVEAVEENEA